MDEEEFDRIAALAKLQLEDAQDDLDIEEGKKEGDSKEDDADKMDIEEEPTETGGSGPAKKEDDKEKTNEDDDVIKEFDLDNYDEPNEDEVIGQSKILFPLSFGEARAKRLMCTDCAPFGGVGIVLGNIRSLAYHAPGEEDPYITLKDVCALSDSSRPI